MAKTDIRMALAAPPWGSVFHVIVGYDRPACGATVALDRTTESSVEATHVGMRCRRRACERLWARDYSEQEN